MRRGRGEGLLPIDMRVKTSSPTHADFWLVKTNVFLYNSPFGHNKVFDALAISFVKTKHSLHET